MRAKEHLVLSDCVDRGLMYGLRRIAKETEEPPLTESQEDHIREVFSRTIMAEVDEYFTFPVDTDSDPM